ncbi:MAG: EsaB/YukD family protein [Anaerolineae bacterium]
MERVIVSLSRRREEGELDLEVPADILVGTLTQEIALALGWGDRGEIYADPPGRILYPHETLAQAGVWDGARLLFQEQGYGGPQRLPGGEGPVRGWRSLDLGEPPISSSSHAPDTSSPPPSGGFVWKRVDED